MIVFVFTCHLLFHRVKVNIPVLVVESTLVLHCSFSICPEILLARARIILAIEALLLLIVVYFHS
jgi:hypothetical protein